MKQLYKIPEEFHPAAKRDMKQLVELLIQEGSIEKFDQAALTLLGNSYNTYVKAIEILHKEGITVKGKDGIPRMHPAVKIANDCETQILKFLIEFGLTPKQRNKTGLPDKKESLSPIEKFINEKIETR